MKKYKIGCDLGNYSSKFICCEQRRSILSVVGYNTVIDSDKFSLQKGILFADGVSVGELAISHAANPVRHKDDRWLNSDEIAILFQAGLSEVLPLEQESAEVICVAAIPINLYNTARYTLERHLSQEHQFVRQGELLARHYHCVVHEIPQGFAVLCAEFLDEQGHPNNPLALSKVGVIDIGGRDLNILAAEKFTPISHQSDTCHFGIWALIEEIQRELSLQYQRPSLSEWEAEAALRTKRFWGEGKEHDVTDIVNRLLSTYINNLRAIIFRLWPDYQAFKRIYLTGGGTLFVGEELIDEFPQACLVADPIFTTALGAEKYAQGY